jgi:uncharacterized protein
MVRWRVAPVWYAVALLLPAAISGGATVLNVLLGAQPPSSSEQGAWPGLIPTFFLLLLIPGIGGAWEEPGWRGPPEAAGGTLGALGQPAPRGGVAFWHLPLTVIGQIPLSDPLFVVAWTVVFTWMFNNTNGSVLIAMLMHNMNNVISGGFFTAMFSGADWVRQGWLLVALWCAVAAIVVVVNGAEHLSRKYTKQTLTPPETATPTPRVV